jgi:pyruvate/2-oxoglutarate dehydrogenase complex dihydrolipoamide dehydrogenase (E3) component
VVPAIPGLDRLSFLTSDSVWRLESLPQRLLVLGGGPVGCELAQAFRRLGAEVTLIEMRPRLLPREDPDVAEAVQSKLSAERIRVLCGWTPISVAASGNGSALQITQSGQSRDEPFDQILIATGRRASTAGFGLEEIGVAVNADGTVAVNEYLQTSIPNIYACGDVAGPYQLTHAAAHQAWHCATNALFGSFRRFRVDYSALPWTVFTDPEVGRVGLSETQARRRNIACEVTRYGIDDLDRAITDGAAEGFVKVLTAPRSDHILGASIVGPHAGELIGEFVTAMRHRLGLRGILRTIHAYPTFMEANRFAAGEWQRCHLPATLLAVAQRYHRWRLG